MASLIRLFLQLKFFPFFWGSFLGLTFSGLVGCQVLGRGEEERSEVGEVSEVPDFLQAGAARASVETGESVVIDADVDPGSLSLTEGGIPGLPTEDELIILDPNDDLEESERQLANLFQEAKVDWFLSHTKAKEASFTQSKPLLIVFTRTSKEGINGSPSAGVLDRELLNRRAFAEWAEKHFIRLRLDFSVEDKNSVDSDVRKLAAQKIRYLEQLKKSYSVRGFPTILIVASDGSVVQRVPGYRDGTSDYVWGLLRQGLSLGEEKQKKTRERLAREGYRFWTGTNKREVFAKLVRKSGNEIELVTPGGRRFKTSEVNLSPDDVLFLGEL